MSVDIGMSVSCALSSLHWALFGLRQRGGLRFRFVVFMVTVVSLDLPGRLVVVVLIFYGEKT
jgi:hypothetical protein